PNQLPPPFAPHSSDSPEFAEHDPQIQQLLLQDQQLRREQQQQQHQQPTFATVELSTYPSNAVESAEGSRLSSNASATAPSEIYISDDADDEPGAPRKVAS